MQIRYAGKFYNSISGKVEPPDDNKSMTYEGTIASMDVRTMKIVDMHFNEVALDPTDSEPIFSKPYMDAMASALRQCEQRVKYITHCDGDERRRMLAAGCQSSCAVI